MTVNHDPNARSAPFAWRVSGARPFMPAVMDMTPYESKLLRPGQRVSCGDYAGQGMPLRRMYGTVQALGSDYANRRGEGVAIMWDDGLRTHFRAHSRMEGIDVAENPLPDGPIEEMASYPES